MSDFEPKNLNSGAEEYWPESRAKLKEVNKDENFIYGNAADQPAGAMGDVENTEGNGPNALGKQPGQDTGGREGKEANKY